MVLVPTVSQAGIFRRRDGTPRQPLRTTAAYVADHLPRLRCRRAEGTRCQGTQCQGTVRNGPWGYRCSGCR